MSERDVDITSGSVRVRDAGDPAGRPVVYFHGTPGSRPDVAFGDEIARHTGVRLVSFDRPGYGGSTPAGFGLTSVARITERVADELGIGAFATLGQSGGGPFALATAAVLGERVTRAGVAAGAAPFDLRPGATDVLDDNDRRALALLPQDPEAAAAGFAAGFAPFAEIVAGSDDDILAGFTPMLSDHDREVLSAPGMAAVLVTSMREALRQGTRGGGWDNVAWVGAWDVDLARVRCPVLLWYGDEDRFAAPGNGIWLRDNLTDAELVLRTGEGHLGFLEHLPEMLSRLTA